jgi:hypothetical protein
VDGVVYEIAMLALMAAVSRRTLERKRGTFAWLNVKGGSVGGTSSGVASDHQRE